jgi:hypothetical protein
MDSAATVTTNAATSITATSFTCNGEVSGGSNVPAASERGFAIMTGTTGDPTVASPLNVFETGSFAQGTYSLARTGLTANSAYRVRAYSINSVGTSYGATITVSTESDTPTGAGAVTAHGALSGVGDATLLPDPPGLFVVQDGAQTASLSWDAPTMVDATHVEVFRRGPYMTIGEVDDSPFDPEVDTPLVQLPVATLTYLDTELAEGFYAWQVFPLIGEPIDPNSWASPLQSHDFTAALDFDTYWSRDNSAIDINGLGQARIVNVTGQGWSRLYTTGHYDLTNAAVTIETEAFPGNAAAGAVFTLSATNDTDYLQMRVTPGGADLLCRSGPSGGTLHSTTAFSAVTMRWWRITFDGTTVLFQTSPDGADWTTRASTSPGWSLASQRLNLAREDTGGTVANDSDPWLVEGVNHG